MTFEASHSHYTSGTEFQIARIEMVANTGTYVDAPSHRFRGHGDISNLPLEKLANLPGLVIDATRCGRSIHADDLWRRRLSGRAVLIKTGWSKHFGKPEYGQAIPSSRGHRARLVERRAALVGIDSLNIDDMADGKTPGPHALLAAGIPIVEHLRGLETCALRLPLLRRAPRASRAWAPSPCERSRSSTERPSSSARCDQRKRSGPRASAPRAACDRFCAVLDRLRVRERRRALRGARALVLAGEVGVLLLRLAVESLAAELRTFSKASAAASSLESSGSLRIASARVFAAVPASSAPNSLATVS
jgi:kynurenine formamidase